MRHLCVKVKVNNRKGHWLKKGRGRNGNGLQLDLIVCNDCPEVWHHANPISFGSRRRCSIRREQVTQLSRAKSPP